MKIVFLILFGFLIGAQSFTLYELINLKEDLRQQQLLEHERHLFSTDLHIYSLQVREMFGAFSKLADARLLRLEGAAGMDSKISQLRAQYEAAERTTEVEWGMLKAKHTSQVKEFALKYESWLKERSGLAENVR